jgi:phosphogluconate dehydratase
MGCANVAHAFAALPDNDKFKVVVERAPNIGIVNAYNDMLSAHAPYAGFPPVLKDEAQRHGATAQVAGGVPAMCDGVTQGTPAMDLSPVLARRHRHGHRRRLSHDVFDAALMLGICDKIVPGLLIGALQFGHLPTVFVPGRPDDQRPVQQRQVQGARARGAGQGRPRRVAGRRAEGLPRQGTCTFYGTANSNQMLMEAMGLHVPGAAFVNPRQRAARGADARVGAHAAADRQDKRFTPIGRRSTSAASSTRWRRCWPPAAPPTT